MQDALYIALESGLRILHPFMPFVTEELWQRLPRTPGLTEGIESIMLAPYPVVVTGWTDASAEADLELANTIVKAVRSLRSSYGLVRARAGCHMRAKVELTRAAFLALQLPKARPAVFVHVRSDAAAASVSSSVLEMCALAGAESVTVVRDESAVPPGCALEIVSDSVSAYLNLKGSVDTRAEISKLEKQRAQLLASVAAIEKQAAGADYETKVPEKVRTANAEKLVKLRTEIAAAEKGIADFELLA